MKDRLALKPSDHIDSIYRSLFQKAARRGYVNLILTLSTHVRLSGSAAKRWFTQQTALTTFRACWPLGGTSIFTRRFASKVAGMINVTRSVKNQDAAGLGAMAYALAKGDRSVLSKASPNRDRYRDQGREQDREVKLIASAIKRPKDFWTWIETQDSTGRTAAIRRFKNIGSPFERAVIQAAAYLLTFVEPPEIFRVDPANDRFPYWVAFDHHVRQGREALVQISRDLHIPVSQLKWMFFYYEGAQTQKRLKSLWWDRYCAWRFEKAGMVSEQAQLMWSSVHPQLMATLTEDANRLHREVYRWKTAHLEQIKELKADVELLFSPFERLHTRQQPLF